MTRAFGERALGAFIFVVVLAAASQVFAETNSYCDDKCGDSQACKFTCCNITTTRVGGVDVITDIRCFSDICCAHPQGVDLGGLKLPDTPVKGVSGPIKVALTGAANLDASKIAVESDEKAKTVTLGGIVKSAAQRDLAVATARKHARGYRIVDRLKVQRMKPSME